MISVYMYLYRDYPSRLGLEQKGWEDAGCVDYESPCSETGCNVGEADLGHGQGRQWWGQAGRGCLASDWMRLLRLWEWGLWSNTGYRL